MKIQVTSVGNHGIHPMHGLDVGCEKTLEYKLLSNDPASECFAVILCASLVCLHENGCVCTLGPHQIHSDLPAHTAWREGL